MGEHRECQLPPFTVLSVNEHDCQLSNELPIPGASSKYPPCPCLVTSLKACHCFALLFDFQESSHGATSWETFERETCRVFEGTLCQQVPGTTLKLPGLQAQLLPE